MKRIRSSDFRTTYQALREPVEVTVLGRLIGVWTPAVASIPTPKALRPKGSPPRPGVSSPAGELDR